MQYTALYGVHIYLLSTVSLSTVVIGRMFTRAKTTLLNQDNPQPLDSQ